MLCPIDFGRFRQNASATMAHEEIAGRDLEWEELGGGQDTGDGGGGGH